MTWSKSLGDHRGRGVEIDKMGGVSAFYTNSPGEMAARLYTNTVVGSLFVDSG